MAFAKGKGDESYNDRVIASAQEEIRRWRVTVMRRSRKRPLNRPQTQAVSTNGNGKGNGASDSANP